MSKRIYFWDHCSLKEPPLADGWEIPETYLKRKNQHTLVSLLDISRDLTSKQSLRIVSGLIGETTRKIDCYIPAGTYESVAEMLKAAIWPDK